MFIEKEGYIVKGVNAFVTERYFLHLEERENSTSSFNMKVNAVRDLQEYLLVSELIEEPFMRSDYYLKKQGPLKPKQDISEDNLQVLVNNLKHFLENIFLKINLGMNTQARHLRKELWESVKDWGFWKKSIFLKGRIIKSLQYALCISKECLFLRSENI